MLYGLLLNLEANAILVYSTLTDMRSAVLFTAGTIARLSIRSSGKHTSVEPIEHQQSDDQTRQSKDIGFLIEVIMIILQWHLSGGSLWHLTDG